MFSFISAHSGVFLAEVFIIISFVLGYYVRGRGMVGVISDLKDIKQDVADLKKPT